MGKLLDTFKYNHDMSGLGPKPLSIKCIIHSVISIIHFRQCITKVVTTGLGATIKSCDLGHMWGVPGHFPFFPGTFSLVAGNGFHYSQGGRYFWPDVQSAYIANTSGLRQDLFSNGSIP